MSKLSIWAKIVALILVCAMVFAIVVVIRRQIKGDGGPDNSIFDKLFPPDPPTTDDTGPSGEGGTSSDIEEERYFGEKYDGEYVTYLTHNSDFTSELLIGSYRNSIDGSCSRLGFATSALEAGKKYVISWEINRDKMGSLSIPINSSGQYGFSFTLHYVGAEETEFSWLFSSDNNLDHLYSNEFYFEFQEEGTFYIEFFQCEYIGDDQEKRNEIAAIMESAITFSIAALEE